MPIPSNQPNVPPAGAPRGPRALYSGVVGGPSAASVARGNAARPNSLLVPPNLGNIPYNSGNVPYNSGTMGPPGQKQAIIAAPVWNPSQGPPPSIMPASGQKLPANKFPTAKSGISVAQPNTANDVCRIWNRDRTAFKAGEIISLPFHEANTNPNLQPQDYRLRLSHQGSVFTKRRMVVVLWIYKRHMFCVPLYSFEGQGLNKKSTFIQPEYVCLKNEDDKDFKKQGIHPPIVATYIKKPFDPNTTVHLTGGMKVSCVEDIAFCGRITQDSYEKLLQLWEQQADSARQKTQY